jgi:hypothetical protein
VERRRALMLSFRDDKESPKAHTLHFDTHAFVKRLVEAGMPEPQAEILASSQAELIEERLATKQDLEILEERLTYRLTIRLGGMIAASVAIVAALVKPL